MGSIRCDSLDWSYTNEKLSISTDILDDLCCRFIINLPANDRRDLVRICCKVELAHWYYLEFYCIEKPTKWHSRGLRNFAALIFQHAPQLRQHVSSLDAILDNWRQYKMALPSYGAILLDSERTDVLLVQSYWSKDSWGFPKGKVDEDEEPWECAAREVLEETGFDISDKINKNEYIEMIINEKINRLYIVENIPRDREFLPLTTYEIGACRWFSLGNLPLDKKDMTPKKIFKIKPNAFFMVLPFVEPLRRWISERNSKVYNNGTRRPRCKPVGDTEPTNTTNATSISYGLQDGIQEYQQRNTPHKTYTKNGNGYASNYVASHSNCHGNHHGGHGNGHANKNNGYSNQGQCESHINHRSKAKNDNSHGYHNRNKNTSCPHYGSYSNGHTNIIYGLANHFHGQAGTNPDHLNNNNGHFDYNPHIGYSAQGQTHSNHGSRAKNGNGYRNHNQNGNTRCSHDGNNSQANLNYGQANLNYGQTNHYYGHAGPNNDHANINYGHFNYSPHNGYSAQGQSHSNLGSRAKNGNGHGNDICCWHHGSNGIASNNYGHANIASLNYGQANYYYGHAGPDIGHANNNNGHSAIRQSHSQPNHIRHRCGKKQSKLQLFTPQKTHSNNFFPVQTSPRNEPSRHNNGVLSFVDPSCANFDLRAISESLSRDVPSSLLTTRHYNNISL